MFGGVFLDKTWSTWSSLSSFPFLVKKQLKSSVSSSCFYSEIITRCAVWRFSSLPDFSLVSFLFFLFFLLCVPPSIYSRRNSHTHRQTCAHTQALSASLSHARTHAHTSSLQALPIFCRITVIRPLLFPSSR